jgi:hypothetical protein
VMIMVKMILLCFKLFSLEKLAYTLLEYPFAFYSDVRNITSGKN